MRTVDETKVMIMSLVIFALLMALTFAKVLNMMDTNHHNECTQQIGDHNARSSNF